MKKAASSCFLIILSCIVIIKSGTVKGQISEHVQKIRIPEFQYILDSAHVKGSVLFYSPENDLYYSNDFSWAERGHLPASTFKIVNSIIALETGVVEDDSTLFKWNGEKRNLKEWEQDLIFRDAFHFSCVPCYQEIARKVGVERMIEYLNMFEYGWMHVDSTNIDMFWLEGESRISQFEQIDFLTRFYASKLPISERTEKIMKRMMIISEENGFKVSGKTGWAIRNGHNTGWFVGYIEAEKNTYVFAANIEPAREFDMDMFPVIRKDITYKAFKILQNMLK